MNQFSDGGYDGNSMSNRAVRAYEAGIMPMSKWSKEAILDQLIYEFYDDGFDKDPDIKITFEQVKKLPLWLLKQYFLQYSEWHHSSSYYNPVDFYCIDMTAMYTTEEEYRKIIQAYKDEKAGKKLEEIKYSYGYLRYDVWGKNKRGKNVIVGENKIYGIVIGDWLYYATGKKRVYGNSISQYEHADTYKEIVKKVPELKKTKKFFTSLIKMHVKSKLKK